MLPSLPAGVLQTSQQFFITQLRQTWATPDGALIAIERNLGAEREQVIGLQNDTTMAGDNYLWLRARVSRNRFDLGDLLSRAPAVSTPFAAVNDRDLKSARDSLGTYFFLEYRSGGQTNCVLAFRQIDNTSRLLPAGTNVLEAMLRNCVIGDFAQALRPITDQQISVSANATVSATTGESRMLSPLAAPQLQ
ncbi:MAG: hypothetical protein II336_19810 [Loktanella sp.]|nr:hypothetical protein [Loktanella sp.]